jgi:hypothetical protein
VKTSRVRWTMVPLLAGVLFASVTHAAPAHAASGPYSIFFMHSDQCVTVPNSSSQERVQLQQQRCKSPGTSGYFAQRWTFEFTSGGYAKIRNQNSSLCINVSGASHADGAAVIQYSCNHWFGNDEWIGTKVDRDAESGIDYYILQARHSGKCLVVLNASTAVGAQLIQWSCTLGDTPNDIVSWGQRTIG